MTPSLKSSTFLSEAGDDADDVFTGVAGVGKRPAVKRALFFAALLRTLLPLLRRLLFFFGIFSCSLTHCCSSSSPRVRGHLSCKVWRQSNASASTSLCFFKLPSSCVSSQLENLCGWILVPLIEIEEDRAFFRRENRQNNAQQSQTQCQLSQLFRHYRAIHVTGT